ELQQRAGNAQLQSAGLAVDSSTGDIRRNIERRGRLGGHERLLHFHSLRLGQEVLVKLAPVDRELSAAGAQKHPGHARLAPSRAVILNLFSHRFSISPILNVARTGGPRQARFWPVGVEAPWVPDRPAFGRLE